MHEKPTEFPFSVNILPSIGWIGYLGFLAQLPWAMVLVYLALIQEMAGGGSFSFAVGIAMGVACNVVRFLVIWVGRRFSFFTRIVLGAICSAFFTFGYFVLSLSVQSPLLGFWLGLMVALLGGCGNALVMSTGYAISSIVSRDRPRANTFFFFGQAVAAALCWPTKALIEQLFSRSELAQLGAGMTLVSLLSLSAIPVFKWRIAVVSEETTRKVGLREALGVVRQASLPLAALWVIYFSTGFVSPGQIMHWPLPSEPSSSKLLTDPKLYKSLCTYTFLLADAVGKALPLVVRNVSSFLGKSRTASLLILVLVTARLSLVPLFFFPPDVVSVRFILLVCFGLLSGSAASLSISLASFRALDQADIAGYLTSFAIINGIFMGSVAGMLVALVR